MAREERRAHPSSFGHQTDFNEEMYLALRQAPWWMISIAVHVCLFVIATTFSTRPSGPTVAKQIEAAMGQAEQPAEQEPPPTPEETEQVHESDVVAKEPTIKDAELSDHNETDNDLPTEES